MTSSMSIAKIADKFGLTYSETRAILRQYRIKLRRGRKRGSGGGLEFTSNNGRFDRRVSWIKKQIEAGRGTSCGKLNDSESLYHCKKCLKDRNQQTKERNAGKKKAEDSARRK